METFDWTEMSHNASSNSTWDFSSAISSTVVPLYFLFLMPVVSIDSLHFFSKLNFLSKHSSNKLTLIACFTLDVFTPSLVLLQVSQT